MDVNQWFLIGPCGSWGCHDVFHRLYIIAQIEVIRFLTNEKLNNVFVMKNVGRIMKKFCIVKIFEEGLRSMSSLSRHLLGGNVRSWNS